MFQFKYVVVYKSKNDFSGSHDQIIEYKKNANETNSFHFFDKELYGVSSAFNYILHLPRNLGDLIDQSIEMLYEIKINDHIIIPIPSSGINEINYKDILKEVTLIIYDDECEREGLFLEKEINPLLKSISQKEISDNFLRKHWKELSKKKSDNPLKSLNIEENIKKYSLLNSDKIKALSLLNYSNQKGEDFFQFTRDKYHDNFEEYFNKMIYYRSIIKTFYENQKNIKEKFEDQLIENLKTIKIPVVLSLSGFSNFQNHKINREKIISKEEREIINLISAHSGIAKNAIVINKEMKNYELFILLSGLERHCEIKKGGSRNYKTVWKILNRIGYELSNLFTLKELEALKRASEITIFSDFPIGIGIFNGNTSPLNCSVPINYKPLTPLTKTLEFEFLPKKQIYLHSKINILILECIDKKDEIREYSDEAWNKLKKTVKFVNSDDCSFNVIYHEVKTINEFKEKLNDTNQFGILIVSAHGKHFSQNNMSALLIGKEELLTPGDVKDIKVPPIVILSACNTSPRGEGSVAITDLFFKCGAEVVLGSCIPINVYRNMAILNRLLANIAETKKTKKDMNLSELWKYVVSSQAIDEILESAPKLKEWAYEGGIESPVVKFKLKYPEFQLSQQNIYEDSVKKLLKIAEDEGKKEYVEAVINTRGYFPESVFYQLIGYPESIEIYNSVIEKIMLEESL